MANDVCGGLTFQYSDNTGVLAEKLIKKGNQSLLMLKTDIICDFHKSEIEKVTIKNECLHLNLAK